MVMSTNRLKEIRENNELRGYYVVAYTVEVYAPYSDYPEKSARKISQRIVDFFERTADAISAAHRMNKQNVGSDAPTVFYVVPKGYYLFGFDSTFWRSPNAWALFRPATEEDRDPMTNEMPTAYIMTGKVVSEVPDDFRPIAGWKYIKILEDGEPLDSKNEN